MPRVVRGPLLLLVDEEQQDPSLVKPARYWYWHGFQIPKPGPFGQVVVLDLVVSRFVYYGISEVTLWIDKDRLEMRSSKGEVIFSKRELTAFFTALRSAKDTERRFPRLPFWKWLDARIRGGGWCWQADEDPVKFQIKLLGRVWTNLDVYPDWCEYAQNAIRAVFPMREGMGRKTFATYERVGVWGLKFRDTVKGNALATEVTLRNVTSPFVFSMVKADEDFSITE